MKRKPVCTSRDGHPRDPDGQDILKCVIATIAAFSILILLPVFGVRLVGKPIGPYLEFPPITRYVPHAEFSWPIFAIFSGIILLMIIPVLVHVWRSRLTGREPSWTVRSFPGWGWAGVAFGAGAWALAWTRFEWFAAFQRFTFSPLWFAYILVVNALTYRQSGRCLLKDRPAYFITLFPFSAVLWWFFEYLNRFVQNWYYVGVAGMTPFQYFVMATLPFSTVLPAVTSTFEWLETQLGVAPEAPEQATQRGAKALAWTFLLFASAGLVGIGAYPNLLFPLLWIAPLLVVASMLVLVRGNAPVFRVGPGEWHRVCLWALAALICGFFWELWNYYSFAKWIYAIPYVNQFHFFEMPVLGYAGYLPFGLECAVVARLVEQWVKSSNRKR
jgi:hypothetical protein